MNLPPTAHRVTLHSSQTKTRQLEYEMKQRLTYYAEHPDEIEQRMKELDYEWDIERVLEANAAGVSVLSLGLGLTVSRKWLFLPVVVAGFLLQHALQGWCPPVPIFRSMGFRTQYEIEKERYVLKAIRGDFKEIDLNESSLQQTAHVIPQAMGAVRR